MLTRACGHLADVSPARVCPHLVAVLESGVVPDLVGLLTGDGLAHHLVCADCDRAGGPVTLTEICAGCVDRLRDYGDLTAWRGRPGILERPEPVDTTLRRWQLPAELGEVTDLAPVHDATTSCWLALTADHRIVRLEPDAGRAAVLATVAVEAEPGHEPWMGHELRPRLHVSDCGRFAAVVHDYGRFGQVLELAGGGRPTMVLDGGSYHPDTVPFSAAFAVTAGRPVLIHRTGWNRLDVSDPGTGELLTGREFNKAQPGADRPAHHLDYFHGRLHVTPGGRAIADDGWVWSPVGMPAVWKLDDWLDGNVWESEDGPSRHRLCQRAYYWDVGMCLVGDGAVAVGGIGDDEEVMLAGVRMFAVASGAQITEFAGPAGTFLSDGVRLYSVQDGATHVWDPVTGHRTATVPGFTPTVLHRGTGELAGIVDGELRRWAISR